jgi:intracellular septation protein
MQLLLDFLPVLAFFIAYKVGGIYAATITLMIALPIICIVSWLRTRKVGTMLLISTGLALLLGGATLALHDSSFIKLKMTIVDWLFALGFLLAPRFLQGKTIVERMMGEQITLTHEHWRQLNWMWIAFFVFVGSLNLYVLKNFSEAIWNNFRFASFGLTLLFVVAQGFWLAGKMPKEVIDDKQNSDDPASGKSNN